MWKDAKEAIQASSATSSIYVGTDSLRFKRQGNWYAKYSTVVIVHKDSAHGAQIFYADETLPDYGGLKNRLLTEVNYAVNAAMEIIDVVGTRHLEVHLDLNADPKHKSNIAVREAIGWCRGMGLEVRIKPDAFGATHAADAIVRSREWVNRERMRNTK